MINDVYSSLIKLCQTFLTAEILCSLFPKEKSLKWCLNIVTVYIFVSLIINIGNINFDFEINKKSVTAEYETETLYLSETEKILKKKIENSLSSVYVEYENIEPVLSIAENGEVKLSKIRIELKYKSDRERARAVIKTLINTPYNYEIEVTDDG